MKLNKLKLKFQNGKMSKPDYISEMHKLHQRLFEYAEFIKQTDIAKIEITDNRVTFTSRNNIKMVADKLDTRSAPMEILNFATFEKNDFSMLLKLTDEGNVFFDIGASIGWVTINVAKTKKHVTVYGFEPVPKTFAYLKENIKINRVKNVKAFNFGFSDEEKKVEFYYNPKESVSASAANLNESKDVIKISCSLMRLDDFSLRRKIKIDVIKCDVEGAELFVMKGCIKTLEKDKPIIFVEMLRKWAVKFHYTPNDTIRLLKNMGYCCYVANNNRLVEFQQMTEQTIETNFFFLHPEKHKDKIKIFVKHV